MSDAEKWLRIGAGVLAVPASMAAIGWGAFVSSTIWDWLMVPIFGIRPITPWQALAIGCMVACFTWSFARKNDVGEKPKDKLAASWKTIFNGAVIPAFLLGIAWVLKSYI